MAYHYEGPFSRLVSDDGRTCLYYMVGDDGVIVVFGAAWADTKQWIDSQVLSGAGLTWISGSLFYPDHHRWQRFVQHDHRSVTR